MNREEPLSRSTTQIRNQMQESIFSAAPGTVSILYSEDGWMVGYSLTGLVGADPESTIYCPLSPRAPSLLPSNALLKSAFCQILV